MVQPERADERQEVLQAADIVRERPFVLVLQHKLCRRLFGPDAIELRLTAFLGKLG